MSNTTTTATTATDAKAAAKTAAIAAHHQRKVVKTATNSHGVKITVGDTVVTKGSTTPRTVNQITLDPSGKIEVHGLRQDNEKRAAAAWLDAEKLTVVATATLAQKAPAAKKAPAKKAVPTITEIAAADAAATAKKAAVKAAATRRADKAAAKVEAAAAAPTEDFKAAATQHRQAFKSGTTFRNVEAKFKGQLDTAVAVYRRQAEYNGKARTEAQVEAFIAGWKSLDK